MPKPRPESSRIVFIATAAVLLLLIAAGGIWQWRKDKTPDAPVKATESIGVPVKNQPVIDYNQLATDKALGELMADRKSAYGVDKGLDMIVSAGESVKIGDETVNMGEIQRKIQAKTGGIVETDLHLSAADQKDAFGIYVVQPGDNIWNIHFGLLRDFFSHKGISVSPMDDEPSADGLSSGVGRLLKFSETMVTIYNIKERTLATDLNMIRPLSKIVVYDMSKAFDLLNTIDYSKVHLIQFDGENIWITAQQ